MRKRPPTRPTVRGRFSTALGDLQPAATPIKSTVFALIEACRRFLGKGSQLRRQLTKECEAKMNTNPQRGDPQYALGKLTIAVSRLATGRGDARSRLREAHGDLAAIFPGDLPGDLDAQLAGIMSDMKTRPPRYHGDNALDATLQTMRNITATKIAARVFQLYLMAEQRLGTRPNLD